jgi:hypothetical protein
MSCTKVLKNSTLAFEDVLFIYFTKISFSQLWQRGKQHKYKKKCHHAGHLTNAGHCSLRSYASDRFNTTLYQKDMQCMYLITLWQVCVTSPCHGKATIHSDCVAYLHVAIISRKESGVNVVMEQLVPFSLLSSYKIFHTAVNSMKIIRSSCNMPNILSNFNQVWDSFTDFHESHDITCRWTDRQTDMAKLIGTFHDYTDMRESQYNTIHLQWKYCHQIVLYWRFTYAWKKHVHNI